MSFDLKARSKRSWTKPMTFFPAVSVGKDEQKAQNLDLVWQCAKQPRVFLSSFCLQQA